MTVQEWIVSRTPPAPVALQGPVLAALEADAHLDAAHTTEVCLRAALRELAAILGQERFDRDGALDLLVVDALTTYAYEYASGSDADVARLATDGLRRFGELAARHG